MSYETELNKISRRKIDLIIMKMDYCSRTFGSAPCTAQGEKKCYNTFPTCQDTVNYNKTEKQYKFINNKLPINVINSYYGAKPYIDEPPKSLPTEIKEKDTLVKRLKVFFLDEKENTDVGIDPYFADRTTIKGTFWKKFIARNKNYKGRIIELYEGFEGMVEADFELKFAGRIDNIEIKSNGTVLIEAVDLMKKLSDIKYPLDRGISLYADLANVFVVADQSAMLNTNAIYLDYAEMQAFRGLASMTALQVYDANGTLIPGKRFKYVVVAYDAQDRPHTRKMVDSGTILTGRNACQVSWQAANTTTSHYRLYRFDYDDNTWHGYYTINHPTVTYRDLGTGQAAGEPPNDAVIYYRLDGINPEDADDWTEIHTGMEMRIDVITDLDEPGYVLVNKEVIYYEYIVTDPSFYRLTGIKRHLFDTEAGRYEEGTAIKNLLYKTAGNPFTHLKALLTLGGITSAYIDAKFDTYVSSWGDVDFSTRVIVKDTTLAKIYFDLINAVDCMSWVGEDGKIKIVKHTEDPAEFTTITDAENIINKGASVDLNEGSRLTRWILYWNRVDLDKKIDDREAYSRANITVDATAESADEYNDEQEDLQYSTWLNDDSDTESDVILYINALLALRKNRTRNAQPLFTCDVELKDNAIKTGDVIKVSTAKMQDEDGDDYSNVQHRVIKKEPKDNKISLKTIRRF